MTKKSWQWLFYTSWFLLLLIQASFIELMSDEAYYWSYSQRLDWGYLDHPPMIAVLIKLGSSLFGGELGVRIVPILLSVSSVYIWQMIIAPKNLKLFYGMVMSVGILHFLNFMAIPDAPFIFFASLFVLVFKKILATPDKLVNYLFIGLVTGGMLLSKYHAVLLIGFMVLANVKLLLNYRFWIAVVVATFVLLPHILWQVSHDYLSLQFHLDERSFEPYHFGDTLEYIVTQFFVLGPITGILFFIALVKRQAVDRFEWTLKFLFWGVIVFLLFMTFKGNVEAHWTFITIIPGLYFVYKYFEGKEKWVQGIQRMGVSILILVIVIKGVLMVDLTRWFDMPLVYAEWQSNAARSKQIADKVWGRPVGFMNSYQKASLYEFYTGNPAFSLSNAIGRRDQYEVWKLEQQYLGDEVVIVANYYERNFDSIWFDKELISYKIAEDFQYYSFLEAHLSDFKQVYKSGELVNAKVEVLDFKTDGTRLDSDYPCELRYFIFKGEEYVSDEHFAFVSNEEIGKQINGKIRIPLETGSYRVQVNVKSGWIPPIRSPDYRMFEVQYD